MPPTKTKPLQIGVRVLVPKDVTDRLGWLKVQPVTWPVRTGKLSCGTHYTFESVGVFPLTDVLCVCRDPRHAAVVWEATP